MHTIQHIFALKYFTITQQNYLQHAKFQKYTEFAIESKQQLEPILQEISDQGYVILNQELEVGLRSIATPLFDREDILQGALTVGTHISRVPGHELIEKILPNLQKCAQNITADLI